MKKRILREIFILILICVLTGCRERDSKTDTETVERTDTEIVEIFNNVAKETEEENIYKSKAPEEIFIVESATEGCDVKEYDKEDKVEKENKEENSSVTTEATVFHLEEPNFIKLIDISFCQVAEDYINLTDDAFDEKYSDEDLWYFGAFDRLLFTMQTQGNVISNIGIGSSLQEVRDTFGECQFGTADTLQHSDTNYSRYLLYGYKTREFYFAFQIDPDTSLVQSICFRKHYIMPEELENMLVVLEQYDDWYSNMYLSESTDEWNAYFDNGRVDYAQWGRGSMTMICDYGFTSTAGYGSDYGIYKDYPGAIPVLSTRVNEWDGEDYEPVTLYEMDYPEWMIYRIYSYLSEQAIALENEEGKESPAGNIYAYSADDGDWLNMQLASGLYETAHVIFHWLDESQQDRHIYFGHYSSVIGFIGDRFFVEGDMMGLHVLDLENWGIVYQEDTVEGLFDLSIDEEKSGIYDENGNLQYSYKINANGDIDVHKVAE